MRAERPSAFGGASGDQRTAALSAQTDAHGKEALPHERAALVGHLSEHAAFGIADPPPIYVEIP